jgi:hypothetical protein
MTKDRRAMPSGSVAVRKITPRSPRDYIEELWKSFESGSRSSPSQEAQ